MSELWRVYSHTKDDESVSERVVVAESAEEAARKAIANVGAQNIGKGDTPQSEKQANTRILCVRPTGRDGVLTVGRIPLAAIIGMSGMTFEVIKDMRDLYVDMCKVAGLEPENTTPAEVCTIIEAMTNK